MLLDLEELVVHHKIKPRTVLHLGAHYGEEKDIYANCGVRSTYWVEADPAAYAILLQRTTARARTAPVNKCFNVVIGDVDGEEVTFYRTNNDGQSSSTLALKLHMDEHPEVSVTGQLTLNTITVDALRNKHRIPEIDMLNMDLQGVELKALRGAEETLKNVQSVYTEVSTKELYKNTALLWELDTFLGDRGFIRLDTSMTRHGWGDAFYMRTNLL